MSTWSGTTIAVLAAEGDTWGLAGPTFIQLYLVLIGALGVAAMLARRAVRAEPGRRSVAGWDAEPDRIAYLSEGEALALTAALSSLHVDGLLTAEGKTVQRAENADLRGRSRLEQAVLHSIKQAVSREFVGKQKAVRGALDAIRVDLEERGLLLVDDQRRRLRRWGYLMLALLALGFTRLCAGLFGGKPVGWLALLLVVVAVAAVTLFRKLPRRSAPADIFE